MYTIAVPIFCYFPDRKADLPGTLRELRRLNASHVFLSGFAHGIPAPASRPAMLDAVASACRFFQSEGLQVGAWIDSIGHGQPLISSGSDLATTQYRPWLDLRGEARADTFCPSDDAFLRDLSAWTAQIAQTGVSMIMLDDDFRLSYRGGEMGCACDWHMAELSRRLGEPIPREDLKRLAFTGGPNRYRDAWLNLCGDTLLTAARSVRDAVDQAAPTVRVGFCSVLSTWGVDGADAPALSRAFAGETRPLLRSIGAPYWHARNSWGLRLPQIIELTRLQAHWLEGSGIEFFGEGDVYPRPRYSVPAAYLEGYDMALRASGAMDGILKYAIDYASSPDYERGYADRAVKNAPAYAWIDEHFTGKRSEGVQVLCRMGKSRGAVFPDQLMDNDYYTDNMFLTAAHNLLGDCAIPMTYAPGGVACAFGDDGQYVPRPALEGGLILDAVAAARLMERGVDVGIERMTPCEDHPFREHFLREGEHVALGRLEGLYDVEVRPGARVASRLIGRKEYVGEFTYENARGERFLVYPVDGFRARGCSGLFRGYLRQRRLVEGIRWLGGKALPAALLGSPDVYMQAGRGGGRLVVGVWNFFADAVIDPVIRLDKGYARVSCFQCEGRLEGDAVRLLGDIPPFGFVGVVLDEA